MKKFLLATTALVGFAGAAAADVKISGSAEMGVYGGDGIETQFHNDLDVQFRMSSETDAGMAFGANVDLDEAGNLGRPNDNQGTSVFISGAFGKLTMGDTPDALTYGIGVMGNGNPGSIRDEETGHAGYVDVWGDGTHDDQLLRYDYSMGAFSVAVTLEQGANDADGELVAGDPNGSTAIGVRYTSDMGDTSLTFGAGYMTTDSGTDTDQTISGVALTAAMANGLSVGVSYANVNNVAGADGVDATHTGIGVGYTIDAISLHANYGIADVNVADSDQSGFGFAAAYDLGGGASVNLGYGSSNFDDAAEDDVDAWSLGMAMSF